MLLSGYIPSLYADAIFVQDVFGGADTKYLASQGTDMAKRRAGECSLTRKLIRD